MKKLAIAAFMLFAVVIGGATDAEAAPCGADFWGSRSTWATPVGPLFLQLYARTTLAHVATHSGCSGPFTAKVELTGGLFCSSTVASKTHSATGTNTIVNAPTTNCGNLQYNIYYGAKGTHTGFGDTLFTYSDQYKWHRTDADGDGWALQEGDCHDGNPNINPGVILTCPITHHGDWNCNYVEDEDEIDCENCPLIISLEGNRIHLTSPEAGVDFDLNGDGSPERLAWTLAGAGGAWLALDRNGNGIIDSGLELFSNFAFQPESPNPNGFVALAVFDRNRDGWIDRDDEVFPRLLVWTDNNHDGVSQVTELRKATDVGVRRISLDARESRRKDRYGNQFRYWARVRSERQSDVGRFVVDVFLRAIESTASGSGQGNGRGRPSRKQD